MSIDTRLGLLLLVPLLCTAAACAQQTMPATQPADSKIHLDVVAMPQSGAPVGGLRQQDFTLLDNKAAQPITSFQALSGNEAPIEVVLLVDAVNTSYQSVAYERGQIDKFLRANGGHLAHPTALAVLTDTGTQIQEGFSRDGNALTASLDQYAVGIRSIRHSAGFYGATERFSSPSTRFVCLPRARAPARAARSSSGSLLGGLYSPAPASNLARSSGRGSLPPSSAYPRSCDRPASPCTASILLGPRTAASVPSTISNF